ncbi:DUF1735 domain-containing protein [Fibrella sp. HMF5335]|uniref:DUF1735 domain-containing protein n=1 Tax=Fibrella rubiginis TaxID=2817060 RepID=A0A939GH49_9BACT|nr:DUF4361 domain-containing protein [Fibrella rubiginis]MBO0938929.1 DUF1735 domain-containing protein [Fibrella rubiginis]
MKKYILTGLSALSLLVTTSGCLQDKGYTDIINAVGAQPIVSIFGSGSGNKVLGVDFKTTPVATELFSVNLGSPAVLTSDVTATVSVDPTLLTGTGLELLPADTYSIPSTQVTIKAGQRDVPFVVNINSSKIDLKKSFALPLTITAASGAIIASNLKSVVYAIKVNNVYAGNYQSTGRFEHPVATSSRDINRSKTLSTIDATTSETEFADLGGSGWTMQLRINADNTVTLIPTGNANASAKQAGVNKYDPATKTFTLNYSYPGAGGDRVITETIKKK